MPRISGSQNSTENRTAPKPTSSRVATSAAVNEYATLSLYPYVSTLGTAQSTTVSAAGSDIILYDVVQRACSYDMPAETVDGMDVLAVRDAVHRAALRGRERKTPTLLEIRTYRFMGHSMSDPIHGHYRTKEEVEEQKTHDPIHGFAAKLRAEGMLDDTAWQSMEAEVADEVEDALHFADEAPEPDLATLTTDVYREP